MTEEQTIARKLVDALKEKKGITVNDAVALILETTKMKSERAVYYWISGKQKPSRLAAEVMREMLKKLK